MITLYEYPTLESLPSASPFCGKIDAYLRLAGIEFERRDLSDPRKSPKGKLPYIRDGETVVADSSAIIAYLKSRYGDPLDEHLSAAEYANALAFQRLIEEHLYYCIVQMRWIRPHNWALTKARYFSKLPIPLRWIAPGMVQKQVRRDLHGQGIGRHTDAEINAMAVDDLRALSEHLGDNQYFMGATPTSYDATAYGFLTNILRAPFELPVQSEIDKLPNLAAYCERLDKQGLLNA